MKTNRLIFQFTITMVGIEPAVWRTVQVPATYSFWDLHVAIQDAMGWFDCHLHVFRFRKSAKKVLEIGIPLDEIADINVLPGWEALITDYFNEPGDLASYEYDFGDSWQHEVVLEGILLKKKNTKYPLCVAGERACPPEDCGSVPGYYRLLEILNDPSGEEFEDMVDWLSDTLESDHPYRPDEFDAEMVKFDNPKTRWKKAFPANSNR